MNLEQIIESIENYVESRAESKYKELIKENSTVGELLENESELKNKLLKDGFLEDKVVEPGYLDGLSLNIEEKISNRINEKVLDFIENTKY